MNCFCPFQKGVKDLISSIYIRYENNWGYQIIWYLQACFCINPNHNGTTLFITKMGSFKSISNNFLSLYFIKSAKILKTESLTIYKCHISRTQDQVPKKSA